MNTNSNPQQAAAQGPVAGYQMPPKSLALAYVLWFFFGGLGVHRFYLGRTGTGIAQLLLTLSGAVLTLIGIGLFILAGVGIWLVVDLFLMPAIAREENARRGYAV
jgi:TM2 domain-containing membrane protein YozV